MEDLDAKFLTHRFSTHCERLFWEYWWVCFVILLGLIVLEQGLSSLQIEQEQLRHKWRLLEQETKKNKTLRGILKLQIDSQSDPAWVELTLKRGLGLVPEGQSKIIFIE